MLIACTACFDTINSTICRQSIFVSFVLIHRSIQQPTKRPDACRHKQQPSVTAKLQTPNPTSEWNPDQITTTLHAHDLFHSVHNPCHPITNETQEKKNNPRNYLEKLTVAQTVKKFPKLYVRWRFITMLTTAHQSSLLRAPTFQFTPYLISLRYVF